jgi:dipeptidyl aminopeptidase/acylaminoacyl peptidase
MLRPMRLVCAVSALLLAAPAPRAQMKRAITFDDLISMRRVSDPQISPDGKWVAFTVAIPDREANRNASNIWRIPIAGGDAEQITHSGHDSSPRWSPDGTRIAFLSSRDAHSQIYTMPANGGEGAALTTISTDVDLFVWSPDGASIAYTSSVFPDCSDDACNKKRLDDADKSKVKARVYDHLLYRHWNEWSDGRRSHLFVMPSAGGAARDLTPAANYDVPPVQRGDAQDIAFSPDSKELCFVAVTDPVEAISTNGDLFTVPADASAAPKKITTNPGFDGHPAYSRDGKFIAYRAQMVPGYESDRWRLMLYNRAAATSTNLSEGFDRSVDAIFWSPDSRTIYFNGEDRAQSPVWSLDVTAATSSAGSVLPKMLLVNTFNMEPVISADGATLVFSRASIMRPSEIFTADAATGAAHQLTHFNDARLATLDLAQPEWFWFDGATATKVEGAIVRPPQFDPSKKYPVLLVIHGGPQNAWDDAWSYRWNPEVFASPGYVVVAINPRGSSGYGQKFTDEITNDWGGKCYQDLMKGLDYVLAKYPFADSTRVAAAGGSFGGYMVDWIAGHTGRFKALISHAGPYDKVSMYGGTEELWFEEHDMAGTPWTVPENYRKWSPSTYAAQFGKFKTPTMVIDGERDYRIPYTQGLQFFTALQRQDVPSKLVIFPDEGHWILKPQNSELWYKLFFEWLATYLK